MLILRNLIHDLPRAKTDAEWREQLDPMQYQVTRHAATERAFTGKYWDHWQDGKYSCVCCGTTLFEAETKFDAGCSWPSYSAAADAEGSSAWSIAATAWCAWRCAASSAAPTWATFSRMAQPPRASVSASIRRR